MMDDFNNIYIEFVKEKDIIKKFNLFLKLHCQGDYAHLIDSDDNAGEFMRQAIQAECNRARLDEMKCVRAMLPKLSSYDGKPHPLTLETHTWLDLRIAELQQLSKGGE